MTPDEATTLAEEKPREFEALVAEKVFGWAHGPTGKFYGDNEVWGWTNPDGQWYPDQPNRYLSPTDTNPVMAVVDHLRDDGWKWSFDERHDGWHVEIGRAGVEDEDIWIQHITVDKDLRLAALLAALHALGEIEATP